MVDNVDMSCRLCGSRNVAEFAHANGRDYVRCSDCRLVFLRADQLPTIEEERAEYALHNNDPADTGYRAHLSRLVEPLVDGLQSTSNGLDFGCGPGPTISVMLKERGFDVRDYDPAFAPNETLTRNSYDFISCSEVVEHFHLPSREFERLADLLKPKGRLGVMTQMLLPGVDFESWYYIREISHVAFYAPATMEFIARQYDWSIDIAGKDVVIFTAN